MTLFLNIIDRRRNVYIGVDFRFLEVLYLSQFVWSVFITDHAYGHRRNGPHADIYLFFLYTPSLSRQSHLCGSRHLATPARALIPLTTLPGSMHTCTRVHTCARNLAYAFICFDKSCCCLGAVCKQSLKGCNLFNSFSFSDIFTALETFNNTIMLTCLWYIYFEWRLHKLYLSVYFSASSLLSFIVNYYTK